MDFRAAGNFPMTIGKYKNKTVDEIASSDEGLLWLDWLRGQREKAGPKNATYEAVCAYLDNPGIAQDLVKLTARGR